MSELLKKEREVVVPGEEIVRSMEFLPGRNCFRDGESILAKRTGLLSVDHHVVSVVPLNAAYIPKEGDMVIGQVTDIQHNGWIVDVDAPHDAFLPLAGVRGFVDPRKTQLSKIYDVDDLLYARVMGLQGSSIYLSMQDVKSKKFRGGRIIRINPAKVPRLIGKQGSMITMIKDMTSCRIHVGQNGRIWVEGDNMDACIKAINMIEDQAASEGLTDKIAAALGGKPRLKEPTLDKRMMEDSSATEQQPEEEVMEY